MQVLKHQERTWMLCATISSFMHRKLLQSRKPHVTVTAREWFQSHRFKLRSRCWPSFDGYLMLRPIAVMDCSMFPHVWSSCKCLSTDMAVHWSSVSASCSSPTCLNKTLFASFPSLLVVTTLCFKLWQDKANSGCDKFKIPQKLL